MSHDKDFHTRWFVVCCVGTVIVAVVAVVELGRVKDGRLFLLALLQEALPSEIEISDAHDSAVQNTLPAVGVIALIGLVLAVSGRPSLSGLRRRSLDHGAVLLCFVASVVADMLSTVLFFHQSGIENELHPAIRLFGYAYGRTAGPLLGKTIQAIGVWILAAMMGRHGRWLIILVTVLYTAAALYNLSQSMQQ